MKNLISLLRLSFQLLLAAAISISVACWFFREEIAMALYWEATPYWGTVLGILMLSYIAVCGTYIHGTLLTANGRLRRMNQLFVAAIILNILGNYLAIPSYGAAGAAGVTVGTQLFAWLGQWYLVRNDMKVRFGWRPIGLLIIFGTLLCISAYLLYNWQIGFWWARLAMQLILSGLLAWIFRLVRIKPFLKQA